jgi:outer membrane lipoprotein carrier protein
MKVLISVIIFITISFANIFDIKTYQGDFTQTITNNSNKEITYKGRLYFNSNGNILWRYYNPNKNVFINQKEIIIDEPELEQVIISTINTDSNLIKILKQSKKIDNKTYTNKINNINYTIKTYENMLQAIFYTDELNNKIKIVFKNGKINKNIKKNIFVFNLPANYDIIRK